MNETVGFHDMLFSESCSFVEEDYLGFLARRVPKNIAEQLNMDGQPDLGLSKSITIMDLMRPLSTFAFPCSDRDLREMAAILGYTLMCYLPSFKEETIEDDPYKLIYAVSLYLHCFVRGTGPEASGYLAALGMLTDVSTRLDWEARLQVCRFLGSLVPTICTQGSTVDGLSAEPAPASSALLALSVIVGSIASDLSLKTESTMKAEKIVDAWTMPEAYKEGSDYWGIGVLKRRVSELYGATGKVRHGSDRLLLAIPEGVR